MSEKKKVNMSDKTVLAYSLRHVFVNGAEVESRPVQWDGKDYDGQGHDESGRGVLPIAYITTCPECGNLIQFGASDIVIKDGKDIVVCQRCLSPGNSGRPKLGPPNTKLQNTMPKSSEAKSIETSKIIEAPKAVEAPKAEPKPDLSEFSDPIKSGAMKLD